MCAIGSGARPASRGARWGTLFALLSLAGPLVAEAQSSPFLTGATALQTNILAWLTPIAVILVMVLGAMAMANRMRSEVAERLRREYRERVADRNAASLPGNIAEPARNDPAASTLPPSSTPRVSIKPWDIEEIRRQARDAWLQFRAREAAKSAGVSRGPTAAPLRGAAEERDTPEAPEVPRKDDLAL